MNEEKLQSLFQRKNGTEMALPLWKGMVGPSKNNPNHAVQNGSAVETQ